MTHEYISLMLSPAAQRISRRIRGLPTSEEEQQEGDSQSHTSTQDHETTDTGPTSQTSDEDPEDESMDPNDDPSDPEEDPSDPEDPDDDPFLQHFDEDGNFIEKLPEEKQEVEEPKKKIVIKYTLKKRENPDNNTAD